MLFSGELIEIQNNLVNIVERRVVRQVRLEDLMAQMGVRDSITFPTLGRTQVFAHMNLYDTPKMYYALTEIPAGIKTIVKRGSLGRRRYRLAMPWTYLWFGCSLNGTLESGTWDIVEYRIFQSNRRYDGVDTPMIVARVPNVYSDARICWGATGVDPYLPLSDRLDILTNEWFASDFNTDLDGSVPLPYYEPNYRRWVTESRENVNCWASWPEWSNPAVHKFTVREILGSPAFATERIVGPNAIPETPIRLTFGRWEEWWTSEVPLEERVRALTALNNIAANNPDFANPDILAATEIPNPSNVDDDDDGGVPVEPRNDDEDDY